MMTITKTCQDKLEAAGKHGDQFEFIAEWIAVREYKRVKETPEAMAAFDVAAAKAWTAWQAGTTTADQDLKDAAGTGAQGFLKVIGTLMAGKAPPGFDESSCTMNWQVYGCTMNALAFSGGKLPNVCTVTYPEYDCEMPMPGKSCKGGSGWIWTMLAIGVGVFVGSYALVTLGGSSGGSKRNPSRGSAVAAHGGYVWATTYSIVTPESAEAGDFDDQGWEHEWKDSSVYKSLADLLQDIPSYSWLEWSSSLPDGHSWITSEADQDYQTGDYTNYDLFIRHADGSDLTMAEVKYIDKALHLRGHFS